MAARGRSPPDGGYGWVVMACSTLLLTLWSGSFGCFGVFFDDLLDHFDSSKTVIAWIAAVKLTTMGLVGVVVGPLIKLYGVRKVIIGGSSLVTIGYVISAFTDSIPLLYVFYGFVPGLGYGCFIVSAPVVVQQYFHKRRGLAVGVTTAGISVGSFMWPPLTAVLINTFGWQGAILMTAGMQLHGIVMGALLRPLPPPVAPPGESDKNDAVMASKECVVHSFKRPTEKGGLSDNSKDVASSNVDEVPLVLSDDEWESTAITADDNKPQNVITSENDKTVVLSHHQHSDVPLDKQIPGSDKDFQVIQEAGYTGNDDEELPETASLTIHISGNELAGMEPGATAPPSDCNVICSSMLDFSICRNSAFVVYGLGIYMQKIGHFLPFAFLPYRGIQLGVTRPEAALLVSIVGIVSGVGRVLFGLVADRVGPRRVYLNGASAALAGVATALSVFCTTYAGLAVYAALFGLFSSMYIILELAAIVDLWGRETMARATGFFMVFVGLCNLTGTPITGVLLDVTDNPAVPFLILGCVQVLGGFFMTLAAFLQRRANRKAADIGSLRGDSHDDVITVQVSSKGQETEKENIEA